jgi:hypothetical protein
MEIRASKRPSIFIRGAVLSSELPGFDCVLLAGEFGLTLSVTAVVSPNANCSIEAHGPRANLCSF